ncbi:hypothetical protein [Streptomyces triticiradicis]|uniref:Uncharacterized protein n=1 Tax=Streptomyces triticiradicis TaxID=2651189 RepID=A0A7J5D5D4_9ACTN|nr:hypothetical protein [Streptomyces triticiradicis]KAB1979473.1 hypothetical protein F8144_36285 [Streptomyces triticiradicis]
MNAELARQSAAQAKADAVVRSVAEAPEGLLLQISVTDPETGQRLATGFVTYSVDAPVLRLVAS